MDDLVLTRYMDGDEDGISDSVLEDETDSDFDEDGPYESDLKFESGSDLNEAGHYDTDLDAEIEPNNHQVRAHGATMETETVSVNQDQRRGDKLPHLLRIIAACFMVFVVFICAIIAYVKVLCFVTKGACTSMLGDTQMGVVLLFSIALIVIAYADAGRVPEFVLASQ